MPHEQIQRRDLEAQSPSFKMYLDSKQSLGQRWVMAEVVGNVFVGVLTLALLWSNTIGSTVEVLMLFLQLRTNAGF